MTVIKIQKNLSAIFSQMKVGYLRLSRPYKLSHLDTIRYEIDMLRLCYEMLHGKNMKSDERHVYVYLEAFLLHYRNLIEFFGGDRSGLNVTDWLTWSDGKTLAEADFARIFALHPFKRYRSAISCYLQHITPNRAKRDRDWEIDDMFREIEPLLVKFVELYPATTSDSAHGCA